MLDSLRSDASGIDWRASAKLKLRAADLVSLAYPRHVSQLCGIHKRSVPQKVYNAVTKIDFASSHHVIKDFHNPANHLIRVRLQPSSSSLFCRIESGAK